METIIKAHRLHHQGLSIPQWGSLFGDETMTSALIDRLLHRCEIIETRNESYRFKNRS